MGYVVSPNLPKKKVKMVVCASKAYFASCPSVQVIETVATKNVSAPVSRHADMQICHLGGNKVVAAPQLYEYYRHQLQPFGFEVLRGQASLGDTYPYDVAYNIAIVGKVAIANFHHADPVIKQFCEENNMKLIHVKQGYAKCSCCIINETALITEDPSIYRAASAAGLDVLRIDSGSVALPGYPYGFLGGAAGLLDKNVLAVTGSLKKINNYSRVLAFLEKHSVKIVELAKNELQDIGSILPLEEQ